MKRAFIAAIALMLQAGQGTPPQKLLGTWKFKFTISEIAGPQTNTYRFTTIKRTPAGFDAAADVTPGGHAGTIGYFDQNVGKFVVSDAASDPGDPQERLFTFDFTGPDSVSGCVYVFPRGSKNHGRCREMSGTQTASGPVSQPPAPRPAPADGNPPPPASADGGPLAGSFSRLLSGGRTVETWTFTSKGTYKYQLGTPGTASSSEAGRFRTDGDVVELTATEGGVASGGTYGGTQTGGYGARNNVRRLTFSLTGRGNMQHLVLDGKEYFRALD